MTKDELKKYACRYIDTMQEELIANGEKLLRMPELAYREYKTSAFTEAYLKNLGLSVESGIAITGCRAVADTGRPGPEVAVMGELDGIIVANHPFAAPVTHAAHACGHHAGLNAMLGCAAVLNVPEILENLSGRIAFIATPSEECQDQPYIASLVKKNKLRFFGGKSQMIAENIFNNTDIAMMLHAGGENYTVSGFNGFVMKRLIFRGKAAHAGECPERGVNAISMMRSALALIDAQRDTFRDSDHVRIHGYIPEGGEAVNVVTDLAVYTAQVRGASPEAIRDASEKTDRCVHASAIAFGGTAEVENIFAFMPLVNYPEFDEIHRNNISYIAPDAPFSSGIHKSSSTDMGDVSMIKPSLHAYFRGFSGSPHTGEFLVSDPVQAYVEPVKMMALNVIELLYGDAGTGKRIAALPTPMSEAEYITTMLLFSSCKKFCG